MSVADVIAEHLAEAERRRPRDATGAELAEALRFHARSVRCVSFDVAAALLEAADRLER